MKYIPAEKLIAKIVELRKELPDTIEHLNDEESGFARGQQYELTAIEAEILCLKQEQPETSNNLVDVDAVREDFIREVYRVLDADPTNDRANAIIDAFDSLPTVSQEQPKHWKPSGKQMEALRKVTYKMGNSCFGKSAANDENLHSLYVELKKRYNQKTM